ncbi:hypothetical protein [Pseudomonas cremoricolorata]|uniref:hypothetical protein n=1 Tax=Pseudomonas cremoricolorata TaxID=157783 RepID=UPI000412C891|nr:hypothetical protein [Pseudomonas cremoricolorata]
MSPPKDLTANPEHWLADFSIFLTSRSDRVLNNGHQQIEVTLVAAAADGQVISDEQFESFGLMYQSASGECVPIPRDDDTADWFYRTRHDDRYDYYPSGADMAVPVAPFRADGTVRSKRLYVHCRAADGQSITVLGTVQPTSGQRMVTPEPLQQELIAEQSPNYCFPQDYEWQRKVRIGERLFDNSVIRDSDALLEFSLRPKWGGFSSARLVVAPTAARQAMPSDPQPSLGAMQPRVGFALPNTSTIVYPSGVHATTADPDHWVTQPLTSTTDQLVIVVQPQPCPDSTLDDRAQAQPQTIEARDRQGALHLLSVRPSLDTRLDLEVSTVHSVGSHAISNISFLRVAGRGLAADAAPCRLYANGSQQTYVDVIIEAVDQYGIPVTIPDSVLAGLELIDYNTGSRMPPGYGVSRTQSRIDLRFSYYQNQFMAGESLPIRPNAQVIRFFYKTYQSANVRVAARLMIDGKTYHSHDHTLPPGDGKTVAGRSNTSAIIEPRAVDYVYNRPGDFSLVRHDAGDHRSDGVRDIDRYHLSFQSPIAHRIVYYPQSQSLRWDYNGKNMTNWIFWSALLGQSSVTAARLDISQPLNTPNEGVSLFRLQLDRTWIEGESNRDWSYMCNVQDENGNHHSVWVAVRYRMNVMWLTD